MANLNDVLRDVLEKDFDKDTVDRVLDEGDETDEEKREHTADSQEESEAGYVGPDMAEYHSVGRGTAVSYTHLDVYKRQVCNQLECSAWMQKTSYASSYILKHI